MPTIVVVGSINMDLVVRAPRHPQPGETILGSQFATFPGGKGANQAVAAARLGADVRMIGRVGEDVFGSALRAALEQDHVDTRFVTSTTQSTGVALITVSDAGQNSIVVAAGANGLLTPADIRAAEPAFHNADVVIAQLEIPLAAVTEAARMAQAHGAKFVLNPAPAQPLPDDLLMLADFIIPNQNELAQLTGIDIGTEAQPLNALPGSAAWIITLGADGALVIDQGSSMRIPTHAVNVVDTTAAGDAFVGAFCVALAEGKSVPEAAAWGNAAGALAVTAHGAQPSLPTRTAVEQLLAG